ncbi:unnamed protein product, partial [Vitis vinifera]|uniref:Uncharacterized protein n=1 Tax=Vitis vinifera TaxID=29760 RepID=D7UB57_VITVI
MEPFLLVNSHVVFPIELLFFFLYFFKANFGCTFVQSIWNRASLRVIHLFWVNPYFSYKNYYISFESYYYFLFIFKDRSLHVILVMLLLFFKKKKKHNCNAFLKRKT